MTALDETDSAPEPVTVKRWRCPFCRRTHSSRAWLDAQGKEERPGA